ncbi:LexA family protein [Larsenimonas suaedae]|uniref:Translesion error-prone DNA polymerase V autoproteolytic subunit n=1 Tax=Larsenimonas suaedae TaxID=1851019 RepID=A0ABU1GUP4_9GAMM|nr:translesion error-prone DNA polymerase V autoproteolytic subunit [Larsenimonas suaedae]MCM2971744.1 translesion error-prone DNA polymerase V autoproteolytic subunit [Larsenimonas suaedae]MDR5895296.1 translesion error-prone DNA polymerase V autoproteolytic subunit [Larsenimonas suaedae]
MHCRLLPAHSTPITCPMIEHRVRAGVSGFPSPAQDYATDRLDLNAHVVRHPASTFYLAVEGDSMTGARIQPGDILVVDRALTARHGHIVIAVVDGEMTVKTLRLTDGAPGLYSENRDYAPIPLINRDIQIWGVVTFVIHEAA